MRDEVLVRVENVSKKFCRDLKRSLWYGIKDIASELAGRSKQEDNLRKAEFWAVKNVSFELKRGECLGLIGHNGAGKSTLLKMLNGLIKPDQGNITLNGRIGALIELGAGFNPILTGRENIYINGQILGFTKKEIDEKFDAIVEFSEIEQFIDTPVQNYSSGMKVRLGFSVAAQMEPDVLLIDEVLAVGDIGFVNKCLLRIDSLLENSAIIFVSHSMPMVSRLCSALVLMEKGHSIFNDKSVSKGIDLYYSNFALVTSNFAQPDKADLIDVKIFGDEVNKNGQVIIDRLDDLKLSLKVKLREEFINSFPTIYVLDKEQRPIAACLNRDGIHEHHVYAREDGYAFVLINLLVPRINLSKGIYSLTMSLTEQFQFKPLLRIQNFVHFQVRSDIDVWSPIEFETVWS